MKKTVIVWWALDGIDFAQVAGAQARVDELNADGYEMEFFEQSSTAHYTVCTAVMVKREELATKEEVYRAIEESVGRPSNDYRDYGVSQTQVNSTGSSQSVR